jgi:hypothetical protein
MSSHAATSDPWHGRAAHSTLAPICPIDPKLVGWWCLRDLSCPSRLQWPGHSGAT